ncbi:DUF2785 domain-containing protein [Nocardioides sp. zg-579]|uniref:DUF2785 domain-containing protein n=1 Tax=Nocardioides marmotae TaxID=2663857 RepID=A0A6I3JAY1_9ACTN|nr:DUF2785 domain-containing protein [Nocardioides marmotae]MCR6031629.1 DUF2785 domain-containing protein [Gordonia jinghuaiqii]MTB95268.1 DUF2785 domain-containing protein [Nocardioides marmotae]QKE02262.1 DUF2785 domain-containing protein [Nocardioides marmotae]
MSGQYWKQVHHRGLAVPQDRPLEDLTAELTRFLGDPDPELRDGTAYPALATWIARGVYDDLLIGLGDGMAAGLLAGLGEVGTDTVLRRSYSARVLAECLERDNRLGLVPAGKVLEWGDRVATWLLREKDVRGFLPGKGWAHAVAHGADALAALARSPHLAMPELTVVLDVVADRVLLPVDHLFVNGEPDRLALATMTVLRRDEVPLRVLEPWIARLAAAASSRATYDARDPHLAGGNAEAFLRALHLQLALAPDPPEVRSDLLLVVVDALRHTNPSLSQAGASAPV